MLLVFTFCFSVAVYANDFNVVVDSGEAKPGETVVLKVSLENNTGIVSILLTLEYDREHLELVDAKDGKMLEDCMFSEFYYS